MQLSSFLKLLGVLLTVGVYEVRQVSSDGTSSQQVLDTFNLPNCDPLAHRLVCHKRKYRTFDGTCNNLCNITRGAANTQFARFLPPNYQNGLGPRVASVVDPYLPLTNARTVTNTVFKNTSANVDAAPSFTHMTMAWGSFIDHDFTLTASNQTQGCGTNTEPCPTNVPGCVSIPISQANPDDRLANNQDVQCIPLSRSAQQNGEQVNIVSSYIDGSNIYGANSLEAETVRDRKANLGLIRVVPLPIPRSDRMPISPPLTDPGTFCRSPRPSLKPCFLFGDFRDNENPTLMTLHILVTREHNRIARFLHNLNPHWHDERLFQEARKIVIAHLQHITYNEWLPVLFFSEDLRRENGILLESPGNFFNGYDPFVDVSTPNSFATAAFRMGHSLIRDSFGQFNKEFVRFSETPTIRFFDPSTVYENNGIDSLHLGLIREAAQQFDRNFVNAIHEELVIPGPGDGTKADLLALNIMRGRDQGLAPYVDFRAECGLNAGSFTNLLENISPSQVFRIKSTYISDFSIPNIDAFLPDIDLYAGGISENPQTGSILGQTFTCLIARTFQRYRAGDRFWYERNDPCTGFTLDQLDSIRNGSSLAKLICDNSDNVKEIQPRVLEVNTNVVHCDDIPSIDLNLWKEEFEPGMEYRRGSWKRK